MLPEFKIYRPDTLTAAKEMLKDGNYKIIAGGTDVIVNLRKKEKIDVHLLDISGLKELKFITLNKKKIHIGALSTFTEIFESPVIETAAPILKKAVENAGSCQIRNRGTIGGNICNASPAADSVPALVALNAYVVLESYENKRKISLTDFIEAPYKKDLKNSEILSEIIIDSMDKSAGYSFNKLARREALAISRMNVVVILNTKENNIISAVISPGSVMPIPQRLKEAEDMLVGKKPDKNLFVAVGKKVGEIMVNRTGVRWSTEYKKPVLEAMVERSLNEAYGMING